MEFKEEMEEVTEGVRENSGFPKIKLCLQAKRGYHLSLPRITVGRRNLPDSFILVDEGTKVFRFTVERLEKLNRRFHDTLQNIWFNTDIELGTLLDKMMQAASLSALHQLCDAVAILDCLTSFVTYASVCPSQMTRPRFSLNGPIVLKQAHHPIILHMNTETSVSNEIFLDETSCMHIITGRNQSGKSTFIRMVAVIVILAHTGSMVPAQVAYCRVLQRITTKLNSNDDMMQGESHFSKEMRDVANILHATRAADRSTVVESRLAKAQGDVTRNLNTLVVIDEVGRATSTEDGFAFAFTIAEHLAKIPRVITLFTTHFLGLGALSHVVPIVNVFHMRSKLQTEVGEQNKRITEDTEGQDEQASNGENDVNVNIMFTYKVENGEMAQTEYGVETARMAGFPKKIVQLAQAMRGQVPGQRIRTARDLIHHHFRLTQENTEQLRAAQSIVRVAQRKAVIEATTKSSEIKQRKLNELRLKVSGRANSGTGNSHPDRVNSEDGGSAMNGGDDLH